MFECKGCKTLKEENQYLRELVNRLLDKSVGPVVSDKDEDTLAPPPPPQQEVDDNGKVIAEHFTYGMV